MDPEDRRRLEQLATAVEHRTTIGIAMGIVMERLDLDADAAFAYLAVSPLTRTASSTSSANEIAAYRSTVTELG